MTAFGPQSANYTTTRPAADTVVSGATDTWCTDCSAAGATDGTILSASFFNVFIANMRTAVSSAGVTLDGTNDSMLWQAMQAAAPTITTAAAPSATAKLGDKFYDTGSDTYYEYVNDGTSNLWLQIS